MSLPIINRYLESVANPHGLFRTLEGLEPVRDRYNRIVMCVGRSAVAFRVRFNGNEMLLKCFLRAPQFRGETYNYVESLGSNRVPLSEVHYLEQEIYVYDHLNEGQYYDVAFGRWVEGETLENALRRAAMKGDCDRIESLAEEFDRISVDILRSEWAHGDIKPENIIVADDGRMTLIDYDAMFIPSMVGRSTTEIGTTPYQHPARGSSMFDKHIDDYSIAIISVSLHALARKPELYTRHNSGDNIILNPAEIIAGRSVLYRELLELWEKSGQQRLYHLTRLLESDTPYISDLGMIMSNFSPLDDDHEDNLNPFMYNGKWGFADASGREIIIPQYDRAFGFTDSLSAVRLAGSWHFIDRNNRIAINCSPFEQIKPFSEGLAAVCEKGLWGYIDTTGRIVIEPRFDVACHMCEGMAAVKSGNYYGYIDVHGQWVIEPRFVAAQNFRNGTATVEILEGRVIINTKGQIMSAM